MSLIFMKELTLERNLMDVSNVTKPSLVLVAFKYIKELTMERSPNECKQCRKTFT
jgi:hypothetical protein